MMYEDFLNKRVQVVIDRPLGSVHPNHSDIIYPINYGYIPGTTAGDGEEIDAYVVGEYKPIEVFEGVVIALIHRKNDVEDKLVVSNNGNRYEKEQIKALVEFQERFFDFEIILA